MNICDELCIIIDGVETKLEVIVSTKPQKGLGNISINNFLINMQYTVHSTTNNTNQNDNG